MPLERNSYWGEGLPIVLFLMQYTVRKETNYSLTIIWHKISNKAYVVELEQNEDLRFVIRFKVFWYQESKNFLKVHAAFDQPFCK